MPRMGDMWYEALRKLNNGEQLSNEEMEAVRFAGNNTQATNDLVNGWQSGIVSPDFAIEVVANEQIGFELNLSGAQEIASGVLETIIWALGNYQDAPFFDATTDATSIYIPVTGWYLTLVSIFWEANATNHRYFNDVVDTVSVANIYGKCAGADSPYQSDARIKKWTKGTQIQIEVDQDSGGPLDVTAAQWSMKKILSPKSRS